MDLVAKVPKIRMVEGVPDKLKIWWENFDSTEKSEINEKLEYLPTLFKISPNKHVVRALIQFWDLDRVVFTFKDFELTPTLEEIHYFTKFEVSRDRQIIPRRQLGNKFLRYLGLKNTDKLCCFENDWVSLDYLYERYGRRDGYKLFRKEFTYTSNHWRVRRSIAFTVALLGVLIFPREYGKISTFICPVAQAIFKGVDGAEVTLVSMILAKTFRALGKCKRGETQFFEGCNILLQMWPKEHFYKSDNRTDIMFSAFHKIHTHGMRLKRFVSPVGTDGWLEFLASRTSEQIQWRYPLLSSSIAYIRCRGLYYIELIGLRGLQTYAPVRVLRQFGQTQIIPLQANMQASEVHFGPDFRVPRARQILHEWNNILTIDMRRGPIECSSEYKLWVRECRGNIRSSPEGEQSFEDVGTINWIRHFRLGVTIVTPGMWAQMSNIMQYLENVGVGPSNGWASSSLP